jgi:hypothetical protein
MPLCARKGIDSLTVADTYGSKATTVLRLVPPVVETLNNCRYSNRYCLGRVFQTPRQPYHSRIRTPPACAVKIRSYLVFCQDPSTTASLVTALGLSSPPLPPKLEIVPAQAHCKGKDTRSIDQCAMLSPRAQMVRSRKIEYAEPQW